jgi:hypothetical protein
MNGNEYDRFIVFHIQFLFFLFLWKIFFHFFPKMNEQLANLTASFGGDSFGEFMESIETSMLNLVQQTAQVPKDFSENFAAFRAAVDWSDKIIQCLMFFHLFVFIAFIITRNNLTFQSVLFIVNCILLFFCEKLNSWCRIHWREIGSQNYFDERGVFAGIFFAGPLLFIGFLQLINFLRIAAGDLIKVKRLQLKQQLQQQNKNQGKSDLKKE